MSGFADLLEQAGHEPAFGLDRSRALHVGGHWRGSATGDYLAHAVSRAPEHLLAHVQRVTLWAQARDLCETYGALLDLFIGLGPHGLDLRKRLLAASADALDGDARAFLDARVVAGVTASQPHPSAPCSVLTRAVRGALDAVRGDGDARTTADYDVIAEAHDDLLAGNVSTARERLERALVADPSRSDVAGELLAIYVHLRDAGQLRKTRGALGARVPDPAAWDAAERKILAAPRM